MSVNLDRLLQLPESEHFPEPQAKSGIAPRLQRDSLRAAYSSYRDLSRRYVTEFNKPRIRLRSIVGLVGASGIGLVIGRTIPWKARFRTMFAGPRGPFAGSQTSFAAVPAAFATVHPSCARFQRLYATVQTARAALHASFAPLHRDWAAFHMGIVGQQTSLVAQQTSCVAQFGLALPGISRLAGRMSPFCWRVLLVEDVPCRGVWPANHVGSLIHISQGGTLCLGSPDPSPR